MRVSDVLRHLRQQHATADARPRLLHRYAAFLPLTDPTPPAPAGPRPLLLRRSPAFLPLPDATPPLSLGEGYTPLVHATRLGREIGCPELHLKLEGMNPTGSFKDRGMAMAVAKALESGARAIICASTGNTSASAAAD